MENGLIIDNEKYELVKGVDNEEDAQQLTSVCRRCDLVDKCKNAHSRWVGSDPCSLFTSNPWYHFKKVK